MRGGEEGRASLAYLHPSWELYVLCGSGPWGLQTGPPGSESGRFSVISSLGDQYYLPEPKGTRL